MKPVVVYLAGAISNCTYEEATEWRNQVEASLPKSNFKVLDPMAQKTNLKGKRIDTFSCEYGGVYSSPAIFARDVYCVRKSDIILTNLSYGSNKLIGTSFEMGVGYALNKTLITVLPVDSEYNHPFIRQSSSAIVQTLEEAIHIIKSYAF